MLRVLRWKEVVQQLRDDGAKTRETLSLWQEYSHLSDQCSTELQQLRGQCEGLWISTAQRDTGATFQSAEVSALRSKQFEGFAAQLGLSGVLVTALGWGQQLQDSAADLQNRMGDVLLASKALVEKLDPPAASLIQSECRLLARSIVQLQRRTSGTTQSLKVMPSNVAAAF